MCWCLIFVFSVGRRMGRWLHAGIGRQFSNHCRGSDRLPADCFKGRSLRWPEHILNTELLLDLTRPHDNNLEKMPTRYRPEIQYLGEHPTKTKNKNQSVGISLPNLGGRQFCPQSTSHLVHCVWVARFGPTSPSWNQIQFLLPDKGQKH